MKAKFTLTMLLSCVMLTTVFAQQTKTLGLENLSGFDLAVEQKKSNKTTSDDTKAVTGSLSTLSGYTADATIEIPFLLDLTNTDGEWVDSLSITFPAGMTPTAVSNDEDFFSFDSPDFDDEVFNGIDGQTVSWGDNDNNWGGIAAPNPYVFTVTVAIDAGVTGDQTISFFASGDEFGGSPADLSGEAIVSEGSSVYGIVVNSPDHTVLEAAVNAVGLAGALGGAVDPLTLFAPTDAAFTELLDELGITAGDLLADPGLADILLYHALGIDAASSGLTDGQIVETLLTGQTVEIGVVADPFAVTVNGENVTAPDLVATNGRVHVIDGVLTPPPPVVFPLSFEDEAEYAPEGFGGVTASIVANPAPGQVNTSETVWEQIQDGSSNFGGSTIIVDEPVDFEANGGVVLMDVWTPLATTSVTLRFEVADNAPATDGMEVTLPTTATNEWETLSFDFSEDPNLTNEFVRVVVFFNLGTQNTTDTFYADNLRFQPTVFGVVEGSEVHETLESVLISSGLSAVLDDTEQEFTLFAPTDDAFAAVDPAVLDELTADPTGALANVLLYHVVGGTNLSTSLTDGMEILTLQGETVTVAIDGSTITINGAEVTIADIPASNGVVHVIDAVLVPATCTQFAGGPYIDFTDDFGGVPVEEDGACPFNVQGFQGWASEAYQAFGATEGVTYEFGLSGGANGAWEVSHVITDNATGAVVASADGNSIQWTAPADGDYLWIIQEAGLCGNQSDNIGPEPEDDNGFPYMTCLGSSTITDIVVADEELSTLETAVTEAGLGGTLAGEGPFTVFAPINDAFDNLPEGLLTTLLGDPSGLLTEVLTHHVANGIVYSSDLFDGQTIEMLNGEEVTIGFDGDDNVTITSSLDGGSVALVVEANIIASNGVIHKISEVLTPTILSVDELTTVDKLNVYPNPANNQFTVDIELTESDRVTLDFINIVGQVVKSVDLGNRSVGLNREYIDINDLSEGIYFMNLTVGDDQATIKVQVVR